MYSEAMGKFSWVLIFIGFNVIFFTQFVLGSKGMPRRYYTYLPEFQIYHVISTVGTWILALGITLMFLMLIHSIFKGKKSPNNPWGGITLEWQTTSPPPLENFEETPVIEYDPYDYERVVVEKG
jgi:cytochrome c oxidase subunit 1